MARPLQFEHYRYLGDKRTQVMYDLDLYGVDPALTKEIDAVLASERVSQVDSSAARLSYEAFVYRVTYLNIECAPAVK